MLANGFRVNTNTSATGTYRNFSTSQRGLERNIERLSSGLRINKAADDTAGSAIATRMINQVRGLKQANRNAEQSTSLIQTAEGGLNEVSGLLERMRELAVQSATDNLTDTDRNSIDLEFQALKSEITRISTSTEYDGMKLINGNYNGNDVDTTSSLLNDVTSGTGVTDIDVTSALKGTYNVTADANGATLTHSTDATRTQTISFTAPVAGKTQQIDFTELGITMTVDENWAHATATGTDVVITDGGGAVVQVGADNASDNQITFNIGDHTATGLSIDTEDLQNVANSQDAITSLDNAINQINNERSNLGSVQSRLEFSMSNIASMTQNIESSKSTITDADFAAEAAELARNQILTQSASAMLAQANQISQNVMGLLRG